MRLTTKARQKFNNGKINSLVTADTSAFVRPPSHIHLLVKSGADWPGDGLL